MGVEYFNKTWDYIDKKNRTESDVIEMINSAHTSFWFWNNYKEHTKTNMSIGLWQLSRVYALANDGVMSKLFAEECIKLSKDPSVDSFYLAYGYEALARSYYLTGNAGKVKEIIKIGKEVLKNSKEKEIDGLVKEMDELISE